MVFFFFFVNKKRLPFCTTEFLTFDNFVDICDEMPLTSKEELIKAFRKIDINGDGFITNDELLKVMTTVSGVPVLHMLEPVKRTWCSCLVRVKKQTRKSHKAMILKLDTSFSSWGDF